MIAIGIDKAGRVCDWSHVAEKVSGFTRDEVLGLHFCGELLDVEGQDVVAEKISRWMGQGVPYMQLPFYTKCGSRKDLSLAPMLIQGETEDCRQVTFTGGLHTSSSPKSVGVDKDGRITYWGEEVAASTEFRPQEVLGMSFVDNLLTYDLQGAAAQKLDQALAGDDVPEFDLCIYSKSAMKTTFKGQVHQYRIKDGVEGATFILTKTDGAGAPEGQEEAALKKEDPFKREQPKTTDSLSTCAPEDDLSWTQDTLPSYWAPSMDLEDL